ncbi:hypothetical protein [Pseudomonas sp. zfem002]|uniref:hypothetical protein n=1 Tax=Pseudomonas sp. zfem002 TaxID=3078197 RepID=UPI0029284767|nr:hypothetical protein [Pseudomonas sp. zfem002]MDU9391546.1 hypothetical protein [Pseudomonas sp. zfem002]
MEKVIVKFTGSWRGYSAGEVAGFSEEAAQSLIAGGRAEVYDAKKGGKPAAKAKSNQVEKDPQPGPSAELASSPDLTTTDPDDEGKP